MKKLTFFDVEYANSKNKSICQIGLFSVDAGTGKAFFPEKNILINPEDGFDNICISVTGITPEAVFNAPNFAQVWPDIETYFTDAVLVGHNIASADLDALIKSLQRYNLDYPEFYYLCTLELSKHIIPSYAIPNYKLSEICRYYSIPEYRQHNALADAKACADVFWALQKNSKVNFDNFVKKHNPIKNFEFSAYISDPKFRRSISELYGIIKGLSIDKNINSDEIDFLINWKNQNILLSNQEEGAVIFRVLDTILADRKITNDELSALEAIIESYFELINTSEVTLSTQILDGILKGITADNIVTEQECKMLQDWLYNNQHLSNHFPFDKLITALNDILSDSIINDAESEYIKKLIDELLNPVEAIKSLVNDIKEKHICLSGNFAYGQKSDVEEYIIERGGEIDSSVKKNTDILIIGSCECQAYSNGTYGTKVKKAIEYNEKGASIKIIKESDFFSKIK